MTALFAVVGRPVIVAHQGGWDEILLIGVPIAVIAWLLMLAKKRVDATEYHPDAAEHDADDE